MNSDTTELQQFIRESIEEILTEAKKKKGLAGACWPGYEAYGFKNKNGRRVPNCAPKRKKKKKS
jgi:hypothetical protein